MGLQHFEGVGGVASDRLASEKLRQLRGVEPAGRDTLAMVVMVDNEKGMSAAFQPETKNEKRGARMFVKRQMKVSR